MPTTFTVYSVIFADGFCYDFIGHLGVTSQVFAQMVAQRLSSCGLSEEALEQVFALTLGHRDTSSPLMQLFRANGVSHVMALSGLHLGIFCATFSPFIALVRRKMGPMTVRIAVVFLVLLAVWFYVCVARWPMSMVRAATMLSISLLSALTPYRLRLLYVWLLSVMLILIITPRNATDIGFQLSAMAMLAIALCCDREEKEKDLELLLQNPTSLRRNRPSRNEEKSVWKSVKDIVVDWVKISFWCQMFTAPLVAHYFGTFMPHAIVTSVVVTAYTSAVVHLCFILIASLFLFPYISHALAQSVNGLLWIQTETLRAFTTLVGTGIEGVKWSWYAVALWYACIAVFTVRRGRLQL